MNAQSVEGVFGRSWQLLTHNWVLIVPGLVVGFVVGLADGAFGYGSSDTLTGMFGALLTSAVLIVISILGAIANIAYTTGMAGAAWLRGRATLADGTQAFERDALHVFVAMIGLFVLGVVAAFFAFVTLGISLVAYAFLFIYTMPAAVVGERRGLDAMADSVRIATQRFWATLIVIVLIAVIAVGAYFIATALAFAPFVGPLIAAIVDQAAITYFILVVVGEYLNLRGTPLPPAPPAAT